MSSRDTDSYIFKREVDSVKIWMNSSKVGHVMRDHPHHKTHILAGMWGLKAAKERGLAQRIVDLVTDSKTAAKYPFRYGNDQSFLSNYVYKLIFGDSIIHDAYHCSDLNGTPWPSRRAGDCFVGNIYGCNETSGTAADCPVKCRPIDHKDWVQC